MNGHAPPASYLEHLEAFQKRQKQDADFIGEVIRNYEELQIKYAEKCDDYNNEVESRRMWQSKASFHERALAEQRQVSVSWLSFASHKNLCYTKDCDGRLSIHVTDEQQGSNSFVLCVLDGDGTIVS